MNKQELIEKFENLLKRGYLLINMYDVLDLVKQLNESQKVTVPQFVADWIEKARTYEWDLDELFKRISEYSGDSEVSEWFYTLGNIDIIARAWLDGYEVEKEPKYTVRVKGINGYGQYLNKASSSKTYCFASEIEKYGYKTKHTRKQLEADGFGDVFDSPLFEVEEVE